MKEKIKNIVGDCFSQVNLRLMFKSHRFIVKKVFKDKVVQNMRSKIAYRKKFNIGKTMNFLIIFRINS